MKQWNNKTMNEGFTLIEILIYAAVLAIIVSAVSLYFLWITRSNAKTKAMKETLNSAEMAMETMTYEIKEAESIYIPTSLFDTQIGQLSLKTKKYLPEGETISYIDFYLCGDQLCLKKESQNPVSLTSDGVKLTKLEFHQLVNASTTPSIQINLKVDYKTPAERPEYQASIDLMSSVSLRIY